MNRKRIFLKRIYLNSVTAILVRLLVLFAAYALCRLVFYIYNYEELGPLLDGERLGVLRGAFIFDSASVFYINLPFVLLSLLPYRNRVNVGYQRLLSWIYIIPNAVALFTGIADIFFFGYKHGRMTALDTALSGNGGIMSFLGSHIGEYWWGILLWIALCCIVYFISFMIVRVERRYRLTYNLTSYYISQVIICVAFICYGIFAVTGHKISFETTTALSADNAGQYVRPALEPLIQSNPFCLISSALENYSLPAENGCIGLFETFTAGKPENK